MKSAYVFNVTFQNETSSTGSLLNRDHPEWDISFRMLYQLSTEEIPWLSFADRLERLSRKRLDIESVIDILAKLEQIDEVGNMTVILCMDGLEQLEHDGIQTSALYREALRMSFQMRLYLVPPAVRCEEVLSTETPFKKQLAEDMGGHGRALEILEKVWQNQSGSLETIDPAYSIEKVYEELQLEYVELFHSPLLDPVACQNVLVAILTQRRYDVLEARI
ncbi:hypothetical protein V7S43_009134 [Phytophthora oleae]|uniref:NACHT domain-containing protein n=1 Tax=Phytophthora oleae TaxID=2107226 RepID=A0ABD3FHF0_9STRA